MPRHPASGRVENPAPTVEVRYRGTLRNPQLQRRISTGVGQTLEFRAEGFRPSVGQTLGFRPAFKV